MGISTGWRTWRDRRAGRHAMLLAGGVAFLAFATAFVGCGDGDGSAAGDDGESRPRVVTTTALLAELTGEVAGDDFSVEALIPAGVDLHSFEPPTEAARAVAEADLLIVNGYGLEESILPVVVENRRQDVPIVVAAEGLESLEGGHEHEEDEGEAEAAGEAPELVFEEGDPHLWMDVSNTIRYVENIRDALVSLDAEHSDDFASRAAASIDELQALDDEVRERLSAIPEERRRIVTYHDAYRYLAEAYDLELAATVLGSNPNQEPSASDIAALVELVRREEIPAIFAEAQFSTQALEVIAEESGARVLVLHSTYTDDVTSYEEMMRATVDALVEGLAS